MSSIVIRPMRSGDLSDVVRIHLAAFPHFFLTFLGPRFLFRFYGALAETSIALVAVDEGTISGFAVGSADSRAFYRRFRRNWFRLGVSIAPAILRRPGTLIRVWRRATQRTEQGISGAELMSVAVDPARQRRGVGRALVDAFAARARAGGVDRIWLLTDTLNNDRVKAFYENLQFRAVRNLMTAEGRGMTEYEHRSGRKIPFAQPDLGVEEIDAVADVLRSGWLTTGECAHEFEQRFAERVGAKHAIALNSCTAALHLALEAIGLQPDDEVIVPAYTFTATAEVVLYFGARPVIVDVDPRTLNIDPAQVAAHISERTRAVIPVHFGGRAADLDALHAITRPRGIVVIEDAAHAFPARYRGRTIGSISDFTCFSFYATKTITTGEGGMLCTNDDAHAERCRVMSMHGINRDAWKRYRAEGSWYYEVVAPGFKYNMTDIAAAIGLAQLEKAAPMRARRQAIALRYAELLAKGRFDLPLLDDAANQAWHLFPLRVKGINRDRLIDDLRGRGIGTSVHFIPLHLHPFYRAKYGFSDDAFPVSTREYAREISLPIYSRMTDADVDFVARALIDAARET